MLAQAGRPDAYAGDPGTALAIARREKPVGRESVIFDNLTEAEAERRG
jgi:hypothetical protein